MKILLVGEYSRLHNSLKEGLTALGHEVFIVGTGDGFKNYAVDFSIHPKFFLEKWLLKKCNHILFSFFKIDLQKMEKGIRFHCLLSELKGFDHVQLINSDAIETHPAYGRFLLKKLFKSNGKATKSLLVCGDETPVIDFLLKKKLKYSILTPYFLDSSLKDKFRYSLKYAAKSYRKQFQHVLKNVHSLIVSDLDYKIPMEGMGFSPIFIPNPINIEKIRFRDLEVNDKVVIFLGINRMNYIKKGIKYFEEALGIIKKKHPDKVEIIIAENLPYSEYIKFYDKAHIVLDMVYAIDQGYNALEAMAKGKVVFSGASAEFQEYFHIDEKTVIEAVPDSLEIANKLEELIMNHDEIIAIGKRARHFIEKEHGYISIAKKYLTAWNK
ncbi:MAG TPA: glycosyltransferase [Flavobacterium sp.]|nr:glycosyltransferase [Flavobacterium sp.]